MAPPSPGCIKDPMLETRQSICIVAAICGKQIFDRFFYNTFKQLIAQENLSFGCSPKLMFQQKD